MEGYVQGKAVKASRSIKAANRTHDTKLNRNMSSQIADGLLNER
jgi:hypothetical protein